MATDGNLDATERAAIVVLAVMGLPGSGKSSLAKNLVHSVGVENCIHIEFDSIEWTLSKNSTQGAVCPPDDTLNRDGNDSDNDNDNNGDNSGDDETENQNENDKDDKRSLQNWRQARVVALQVLENELNRADKSGVQSIGTGTATRATTGSDGECASSQATTTTTTPDQHPRHQRKKRIVLLDDTFHLRSMRKNIFDCCYKHVVSRDANDPNDVDICFGTAWVDTDLSVCIDRNARRDGSARVRDAVMTNIGTKLEPPHTSRSGGPAVWWEQHSIVLSDEAGANDNGSVAGTMATRVLAWVDNVVLPRPICERVLPEELKKEPELETRIGELDKLMRKWVGRVASIDKSQARHANNVRKELLKSLRQDRAGADAEADASLERVANMFSANLQKENGLFVDPMEFLCE